MAPFEIILADATLRATLRGYWDIATARRYAAELKDKARASNGRARRWLIDLTDSPVQPRDVTDVLKGAVLEATRHLGSPRIAVVGSGALLGLQAKRVGPESGHRYFTLIAEAEAWLASEPDS